MAERVHKQKPVALWPEEWAELDRLAAEFRCLAPSGPTAGEPSWRSLVKELARGRFRLVERDGWSE